MAEARETRGCLKRGREMGGGEEEGVVEGLVLWVNIKEQMGGTLR